MVEFTGSKRLSQYQLEKTEVVSVGKSKILLHLYLRRIYQIYFLSLFIPSLCLIVAAEMTLFVDEKHFEASIMVALTATLVMYTLYTGISEKLPVSSDIKMIDIWLLQGILTPFLVFVILVTSKLLQTRKKPVEPNSKWVSEKRKKQLKEQNRWVTAHRTKRINFLKICQIVMPTLSVIFIVIYFTIVLCK